MSNADTHADIAVIGAGVVGCAIAHHFAHHLPGRNIVVLEKLAEVGRETSRFNSGVLHSGLHQHPKYLKSKFARQGCTLTVDFCTSRKLSILHTGMIVAISWEALKQGLYKEVSSFLHLLKRGREQDINFRFLTGKGLKTLESNLKAAAGIFIPAVWVIDPVQMVQALQRETVQKGVEFYFSSPVTAITLKSNRYHLETPHRLITATIVINAAGLYADEVAKLAGFNQYKIYPWRGEYYEIVGEKRNLVHRLVYPAVPANAPGKGIHFSPRVDGRLYLGPNARLVPRKDYYEEDKTPLEEFWRGAREFLPDLEPEDLRWAYSGIRAKVTDKEQETDFIISLDRESPPFVNLIGIESPGLTAALAIARYVYNLTNRS